MRYKLTAEVKSNIFVAENVSTELENVIVEFSRDNHEKLMKISVCKQVLACKSNDFKQSFEPSSGNMKLKISIGGDKELHNELIKELQRIESNLAFATHGLLKRVRWDNPQQEYIPENAEEENLIDIRNFSPHKAHPEAKANVTTNMLIGLTKLSPNYESLLLAKVFWRERMIYHNNLQSIQAFHQFYFVLEDFYISGKSSSKRAVIKIFNESKELLDIADKTLTQIQNLPKHKSKLENFSVNIIVQIQPQASWKCCTK
jgi:hypothetical protein